MRFEIRDIWLTVCIFLHSTANGVLDNIDHHSGARTLKDIWHLTKLADRITLVLVGVFAARCKWPWWKFAAVILVLFLAKYVWSYFYLHHIAFWVQLDDTVDITTGWAWLDEFLGFEH